MFTLNANQLSFVISALRLFSQLLIQWFPKALKR